MMLQPLYLYQGLQCMLESTVSLDIACTALLTRGIVYMPQPSVQGGRLASYKVDVDRQGSRPRGRSHVRLVPRLRDWSSHLSKDQPNGRHLEVTS
jgi:hypothetical protein